MELTVIKHKLRDWESRLTPLAWDGGPEALARQLNADLKQAGLLCAYDHPAQVGETPCPEWSLLGFLDQIKLYRPPHSEFLVLQTGVGIECGFDESAHAYEWSGDKRRRFWETEQDDYAEKTYLPQRFRSVLISPTDYQPEGDKSTHLVLTLGVQEWCESNWHEIYVRVWRTKGAIEPKLMLDEREWAFVEAPILGTVGRDDVLVEYAVALSGVGPSRRQVRHYVVDKEKVERVDPIALGPRDFADEWLTRPWQESVRWTEPGKRATLARWHGADNTIDFSNTTMHCRQSPDLWQVMSGYDVVPWNRPLTYFLVRWRPPYRFTMVDVSDHPWRTARKLIPKRTRTAHCCWSGLIAAEAWLKLRARSGPPPSRDWR